MLAWCFEEILNDKHTNHQLFLPLPLSLSCLSPPTLSSFLSAPSLLRSVFPFFLSLSLFFLPRSFLPVCHGASSTSGLCWSVALEAPRCWSVPLLAPASWLSLQTHIASHSHKPTPGTVLSQTHRFPAFSLRVSFWVTLIYIHWSHEYIEAHTHLSSAFVCFGRLVHFFSLYDFLPACWDWSTLLISVRCDIDWIFALILYCCIPSEQPFLFVWLLILSLICLSITQNLTHCWSVWGKFGKWCINFADLFYHFQNYSDCSFIQIIIDGYVMCGGPEGNCIICGRWHVFCRLVYSDNPKFLTICYVFDFIYADLRRSLTCRGRQAFNYTKSLQS